MCIARSERNRRRAVADKLSCELLKPTKAGHHHHHDCDRWLPASTSVCKMEHLVSIEIMPATLMNTPVRIKPYLIVKRSVRYVW